MQIFDRNNLLIKFLTNGTILCINGIIYRINGII